MSYTALYNRNSTLCYVYGISCAHYYLYATVNIAQINNSQRERARARVNYEPGGAVVVGEVVVEFKSAVKFAKEDVGSDASILVAMSTNDEVLLRKAENVTNELVALDFGVCALLSVTLCLR